MSLWPENRTEPRALGGREGELVSVRIVVEPRLLENLLETLASVSFPINPQIYHHAAVLPGQSREAVEARLGTVVEFPAFSRRLEEVRSALEKRGFDRRLVNIRSMLTEIAQNDSGPILTPKAIAHSAALRWKQ